MDRVVDEVLELAGRAWRPLVWFGVPLLVVVQPVVSATWRWSRAAGVAVALLMLVGLVLWWGIGRRIGRRWPDFSPLLVSAGRTDVGGQPVGPNYRVALGRRLDDTVVWLDPRNTCGVMVTGIPGSGKTALVQIMVGEWLTQGAQVRILDFKGGGDFAPFAAAGVPVHGDDMDQALACLREIDAERENRLKWLKESRGEPNFWNRPPGSRPLLVLVIDEAQELFEKSGVDKDRREQVAEAERLVKSLVKLGRAAGVLVVLCTQKADATAIPTAIRDQLSVRISGEQKTLEASKIAVGELREGEPLPHRDIPRGEPGWLIMAGSGTEDATLFRGRYMSQGELERALGVQS